MRHRKEAVWGHGREVAISERGQRPCRDPPCQHLDPGLPASELWDNGFLSLKRRPAV